MEVSAATLALVEDLAAEAELHRLQAEQLRSALRVTEEAFAAACRELQARRHQEPVVPALPAGRQSLGDTLAPVGPRRLQAEFEAEVVGGGGATEERLGACLSRFERDLQDVCRKRQNQLEHAVHLSSARNLQCH
eukprot:TRINITY_DN60368_c0_g1_i1.p2 TRINITY_DN60368_c0_g1~~TRINITY_DN60368_c0_g1_i1.p2  ORF type:complete len:135 (+),score=34.77 TRINITY_DN60368_c0_g1_i1:148-552(+)